jgi:hypothetical protein
MRAFSRTWVHWITAAAVMLTSLAPMAGHVSPIISDAGSLKMAVCAPSGEQIDLRVDLELPEAHQAQTSCAYCMVQDSYAPSIDQGLQFAVPETISNFHFALHASPLPIISWMQLPSRAPPLVS